LVDGELLSSSQTNFTREWGNAPRRGGFVQWMGNIDAARGGVLESTLAIETLLS
jgi:hypothetical protein